MNLKGELLTWLATYEEESEHEGTTTSLRDFVEYLEVVVPKE